jgi:LPXTG-site transpeptidase (sortase) family protein
MRTWRSNHVRPAVIAVVVAAGVAVAASAMWDLWGSDLYADWRQERLAGQLAEASQPVGAATELGVDDGSAAHGTGIGWPRITPAGAGAPFVEHGGLVDLLVRGDRPYIAQPDQATPAADTATEPAPNAPETGAPVGRIRIDAIGLDQVFVAGADDGPLRSGPGWYQTTAFPGSVGNTGIAGHRTTYGGPFRHLDQLKDADRIVISVPGQPDAVYEVRAVFIVGPDAVGVLAQTTGVRLTLTTCDPIGSDAQRLIVQAELVEGAQAGAALDRAQWQPQQ